MSWGLPDVDRPLLGGNRPASAGGAAIAPCALMKVPPAPSQPGRTAPCARPMTSGVVTRKPPRIPVEAGRRSMSELRATAVDDDRLDADGAQEHHVLGERGLQAVVGRNVAAMLIATILSVVLQHGSARPARGRAVRGEVLGEVPVNGPGGGGVPGYVDRRSYVDVVVRQVVVRMVPTPRRRCRGRRRPRCRADRSTERASGCRRCRGDDVAGGAVVIHVDGGDAAAAGPAPVGSGRTSRMNRLSRPMMRGDQRSSRRCRDRDGDSLRHALGVRTASGGDGVADLQHGAELLLAGTPEAPEASSTPCRWWRSSRRCRAVEGRSAARPPRRAPSPASRRRRW